MRAQRNVGKSQVAYFTEIRLFSITPRFVSVSLVSRYRSIRIKRETPRSALPSLQRVTHISLFLQTRHHRRNNRADCVRGTWVHFSRPDPFYRAAMIDRRKEGFVDSLRTLGTLPPRPSRLKARFPTCFSSPLSRTSEWHLLMRQLSLPNGKRLVTRQIDV